MWPDRARPPSYATNADENLDFRLDLPPPPLTPFEELHEDSSSETSQPQPLENPPRYNIVRLPPAPLKYGFSQLSHNAMLLIPSALSPDSRPMYHISVYLNCFNPTSSTTVVHRGANEHGREVGQFELGISSEDATIVRNGHGRLLKDVIAKHGGSSPQALWSWKLDESNMLVWDCQLDSPRCFLRSNKTRREVAVFSPASYVRRVTSRPLATAQLLLYPEGQAWFDDIILSALVIERLRLIPSSGVKLISFQAKTQESLSWVHRGLGVV